MLDFGYFQLARVASNLSTHHQYHVGAVIVSKKPVAIGFNMDKTHPIFANMQNGNFSIHAEIKAILSCPRKKLKNAEMWVYRERRDGKIGCAKPCEHCLKVIIESGIKRVYYTTDTYPFFDVIVL